MDSIEAHEKRANELHGEEEDQHHEGEVFDMDSRDFATFTDTRFELVKDGDLKFLRVFQINDWKVGKNEPKLPSIEM